jgi:hypothetical protein
MAYEQEKINMPKSDSWHRNRRRKQALLRQRMAFLAVLAVSGLVLTMVLLRSCHGR